MPRSRREFSQAPTRSHLLSSVLRTFQGSQSLTRAAISAQTQLGRATIADLVSELLARGLLAEELEFDQPRRVGRPSMRLRLDGRHVAGMCIQAVGDRFEAYAADLGGRAVLERRRYLGNGLALPERLAAELTDFLSECLGLLQQVQASAAGVVIAVPGLVDVGGTVLRSSADGWRRHAIQHELAAAFHDQGLRIRVDQASNLAALGEYWFGSAAGTRDLIRLDLGLDVGAGVVLGGRLVRGAEGFLGDVGHIPVGAGGVACRCGLVGCWESSISLGAFLQSLARRGLAMDQRDVDLGSVAALAEKGDPAVLAALVDLGRWLGVGCAALVQAFDPRLIIVAGYLEGFARFVLPRAIAELASRAIGRPSSCALIATDLGAEATLRGGVRLVNDSVLSRPSSVARPPGPQLGGGYA